MRTSYLLSATATALIGLTGSAYAGVLDVTNVSVDYYESVSWNAETLANGASVPTSEGYTGEILLTTPTATYATWCVDVFHDVYLGNNNYMYSAVPLSVDNSGASPATSNPLTTTQQTDIAWLAYEGTAAMNANPSDDVSAAYQAAIWTVEYGLTGVNGSSSFDTEYTDVMDLLSGATAVSGTQLSTPLNSGLFTAQNLYTSSAVPEPSTYAMMGLGSPPSAWPAFGRRQGQGGVRLSRNAAASTMILRPLRPSRVKRERLRNSGASFLLASEGFRRPFASCADGPSSRLRFPSASAPPDFNYESNGQRIPGNVHSTLALASPRERRPTLTGSSGATPPLWGRVFGPGWGLADL